MRLQVEWSRTSALDDTARWDSARGQYAAIEQVDGRIEYGIEVDDHMSGWGQHAELPVFSPSRQPSNPC
jgi:hypothetical protein